MNENKNNQDQPYTHRQDTEQTRQTGNVNQRNNNVNVDNEATSAQQNIETANNAGIGDAGLNDEKLSSTTQNHSSDA